MNKDKVINELVSAHKTKLEAELQSGQLLGEKGKGRQLYLYLSSYKSVVLVEIGRLRSETFRHTGLGVCSAYDLDDYDFQYEHMILWDSTEKAIIGAFRIMPCSKSKSTKFVSPLYTQTIFQYSDKFKAKYFDQTIEMGRMFICRSHWGSRSMDYLWYGMAYYFTLHPEFRYFLTALSIPSFFSPCAKKIIQEFCTVQFPDNANSASALHPYSINADTKKFSEQLDNILDDKERFQFLQAKLSEMKLELPVLFKNTKVFHRKGVRFLAFGLDTGFSDAFDGLMFADIHRMQTSLLNRYTSN